MKIFSYRFNLVSFSVESDSHTISFQLADDLEEVDFTSMKKKGKRGHDFSDDIFLGPASSDKKQKTKRCVDDLVASIVTMSCEIKRLFSLEQMCKIINVLHLICR